MVGEGEADAHAGLFFSDERARFLEYGGTLTNTETHFFVAKDLPPIESVEELAGHRVGVLAGDFVKQFLKERLPARDVVGFGNYSAIMTALREGKLQIFAADTPTGIFHLQNSGLGFAYVFPADQPLYRNDWLVAAAKGNTELIGIIDAGMAGITKDERSEIEERWVALGTEGFSLSARDFAILAAILGIAAAAGGVIWIRTLRRSIELRTMELKTELGQRETAEEALRESEERYALAIRGSNEGLSDWDVGSDVLRVTPRFNAISGLTTDSLEITPDPSETKSKGPNHASHKGSSDFINGIDP